jgi:hypothetical protein
MRQAISRRMLLTTLALSVVPIAAVAQPTSGTGDPLTVELTGIALPMVRGTALVNYVFGVIQIQLGDGASTFYFRENSFLLRDAIVRIASRNPIPEGPTRGTFDRVAVTRVVLQAIQAVRPNTRVVRVTVQDAALMRN